MLLTGSDEWSYTGELYAEIEAEVECLVKCVSEEASYRYDKSRRPDHYYADLHEKSKAELYEAREALMRRLWKVCKSPGREVYRALAASKQREKAILVAQGAIVGQVFDSMTKATERMREKYEVKIAELRG